MHTLYTFGYTGRSPQELKELADSLGAAVVDTRYSPNSRDARWRRSPLERVLGSLYQGAGETLGNVNYKAGPIRLADEERGLAALGAQLAHQPIILLCMCRDAAVCHRTYIAQKAAEQFGVNVENL
ncbi:MAG: hypothetical protein AB7T37_03295 [Dehalococcoidia bacterium]